MGIAQLSDVAFMKRFAKCNEWFKMILSNIRLDSVMNYEKSEKLKKYAFVALDAFDITEKGATKRIFRLHYAIDIFTMAGLEYRITNNKTGESLTNFNVKPNRLIIVDRAYGGKKSIEYCLERNANFMLRIKNKAFKLYDERRNEIEATSKNL